MLPASLSGRTLRQQIHLHAGGDRVRLRLSNRYGDAPVTLSSICVSSVSRVSGNPFLPPEEHDVPFQGQTTLTLAAKQEAISDPVTLRVEGFSDLAITFFVAHGDCLTGHMGARQTSSISGLGDMTKLPKEWGLFGYALQTSAWWLITGIDVLPPRSLNAVVTLGSSTTDGYGSSASQNKRWPDYLARRLAGAGGTRFMSVINAGLDGNQLTSSEIPAAAGYGIPRHITGEAGIQRLNWDVLAQPGATDLIVHIGSNDLRMGVPGATVTRHFQHLSSRVKKTYRRVFGTTILPGAYTPAQEAQRQSVNSWIREQGLQWFDAVFDFATPMTSPDDPGLLNPKYDSGDGIHPNDDGYQVMAEAVDFAQLTGSPDVTP